MVKFSGVLVVTEITSETIMKCLYWWGLLLFNNAFFVNILVRVMLLKRDWELWWVYLEYTYITCPYTLCLKVVFYFWAYLDNSTVDLWGTHIHMDTNIKKNRQQIVTFLTAVQANQTNSHLQWDSSLVQLETSWCSWVVSHWSISWCPHRADQSTHLQSFPGATWWCMLQKDGMSTKE